MAERNSRVTERAQRRLGTQLAGKWTLERLIGVGGMAAVYVGVHRNKKRAAIKVLHPELSVESDIRARFLREGYVANSVGHPGAVRVDDDDVTDDGAVFLVMELLEGETVDARWRRKSRKLDQAEALWIGEQVLDVLETAHGKGILHRDIKPENLFVTRDGALKVLDFGIARLREPATDTTTTQSGVSMGTPAYMAPEQARGRWSEVDARTDLWAVGAVLFSLLSGRFVHEAETPNEALARAISDPARPIREVRPEVPESVARVIDRALAYDKERRFESAAQMRAALRNGVRGLAVRSPSLTLPDTDADRFASVETTVPALRLSRRRSLMPLPRGGWLALGAIASSLGVAVAVALALRPADGNDPRASRPPTDFDSGERSAEPEVAPVPDVLPASSPSDRVDGGRGARATGSAPAAVADAQRGPAARSPEVAPSASAATPPGAGHLPAVPVDCDPPFVLDPRGIKRFRAECL